MLQMLHPSDHCAAALQDLAPSHEQLFFLIDASPGMLQPCGLAGSEEFEGKSWLEAAIQVAASIMRQKVIASSGDKVAVMLYGTVRARCARYACTGCWSGLHACRCTLHLVDWDAAALRSQRLAGCTAR
jgi:hypothetical protein